MSTLASLDNTAPTITPGGEVRCTVRVRNGGEIVESYRFQVVGDPGQFATIEPPTISLYPAAEGTATVVFRVPRGSRMIATDLPFAVRVLPTERPQFATAAEGVLRVLPFRELSGEILPRTSRGYRTAKHEVAIDNKGNTPVTVALTAADQDQALDMKVTPPNIMVPPGQAIFASVRVRHRRLLWRGQPVTRPFRVTASPLAAPPGPGGPPMGAAAVTPPMTYDASTVQRPIISSATAKKLVAALAALAVLAAVWFLLLKPAVQSAAKDAVAPKNATQPLNGGAGGGPAGGSSGGGPTSGPSGTETPFNHRLGAQAGAGGTGADQFTVGNKTTFLLTDLVLQNPQGDTGRVDVLVNNQVILTMSLANFRDQDYHLVTPVEAGANQTVGIKTNCTQPGPPLAGTSGTACRTFVLVIGMGIPATS
jgi:hypothetical protein